MPMNAKVLEEIHTRFHSAYMAKIEEHDEFHAKHTWRLLHPATTPPTNRNKDTLSSFGE